MRFSSAFWARVRGRVATLAAGEKAPAFHLHADDGREVALKDFHGRNVVFYFFPKALTPG